MNPGAQDDWMPCADIHTLQLRAQIYARIRRFFADRQVMEVDTPVLSAAAATDPHIDSFSTDFHAQLTDIASTLYLRTSPEFHMKRLLCAGIGDIYQLGPVFRNGEHGSIHNPEFIMLEWYRLGIDHQRLMREVEALLRELIADKMSVTATEYISYREVFLQQLNLDVFTVTLDELHATARSHGLQALSLLPRDDYLHFLFSHCVQPALGQGCISFVFDFPASQCALARIREEDIAVAERFEAFIGGVELCNGFHELRDADEQLARFNRDNTTRANSAKPILPVDKRLINALQHGLPACAGVALGIDRLIALIASEKKLGNVLAFDIKNA